MSFDQSFWLPTIRTAIYGAIGRKKCEQLMLKISQRWLRQLMIRPANMGQLYGGIL